MATVLAFPQKPTPQVTDEVYVTPVGFDGLLPTYEVMVYRSVHAGVCGPFTDTEIVTGLDGVFEFTVLDRTDKFVTFSSSVANSGKARVKIHVDPRFHDGAEHAYPLGRYSMAPIVTRPMIWHADDCGGDGACDGCGWIDARLRWWPGPCPWYARRFQRLRSELGVRFIAVDLSAVTR